MNKALRSIQPSATLAIAARANQLKAEGKKVCNFSVGEPDFHTPEVAKEACIASIHKNQTRYTPINGIASLCESIATKLATENGLTYDPSQIIVSCGAKHSLGNIFLALLNPGDEVIIPAPYWLSYPEMVRIAGGIPKFVTATETAGLKITPEQLEAALTPKTVAFIMNSPSNPTGMVYTATELKALADICVKHNVWIVSDEVYERMVYDGATFTSVGALSPDIFAKTITVNGFSKTLAMTGWRIGYTAGPKDLIKAMSTVQSHTSGPPATFVQAACTTAPKACEADIRQMVKIFAERRTRIVDLLTQIKGVTCVKPTGAFYAFPNIAAFGLDSQTFSERLIDTQAVAVVPGCSFGADANIRLSYACAMEEIEEGIRRIKEFCESL